MSVERADALPRDATVALTNARVVDVAAGAYYPAGISVLIRGAQIVALAGLPGQPAAPAPDLTLDLGGRALIPSLFNAHCHVHSVSAGLPTAVRDVPGALWRNNRYALQQIETSMQACLERGITTVRDAATEDLRPARRLRQRIASGTLPGPRLVQSVVVGPVGSSWIPARRGLQEALIWRTMAVRPTPPDAPYAGVVAFPPDADEQAVRAAVDRAIDERGADVIKVHEQSTLRFTLDRPARIMPLAQLDALIDQARRRGVPTQMHHIQAAAFRRAVQVGVTSLDHFPYDAPLTEADGAACLAAGCVLVPTMWAFFYAGLWPMAGQPWSDHPRMRRLAAYRSRTYREMAPYWTPALRAAALGPYQTYDPAHPSLFAKRMGHSYAPVLTHGADNLLKLYAAGVPFGCGNDAGALPCTPAMVREEIGVFDLVLNEDATVMTGADALRAATLHSARALGLEQRLGSIAPGKLADLVVLEGDPLADPTRIGAPAAAVFQEGRLVVNACGLRDGQPSSAARDHPQAFRQP
ncbi:MAG: amidohydrolase family protein [Anaerolineales bacterium]|nr:amidohydrolase family protein [Anaerolineales bacterium]